MIGGKSYHPGVDVNPVASSCLCSFRHPAVRSETNEDEFKDATDEQSLVGPRNDTNGSLCKQFSTPLWKIDSLCYRSCN